MWTPSRLATLKESGSEGRRDEAISWRKRSEKVLKDRDLLFGKHLSLAIPDDCDLIWKCNTVPWTSSVVPDVRPWSTLWGLPWAWPRSPSEPFLAGLCDQAWNIAYAAPDNRFPVLLVSPP